MKVAKENSQIWSMAALSYFSAAALTIHLTSNGKDIATIWPANAILVALLLAEDRPRWTNVLSAGFIGGVAANYVMRGTLIGPIAFGLGNIVEIWIAATCLRCETNRDGILQSTPAVARFIAMAGLAAPTLSGVIGAAAACSVYGEPFWKSFSTWLASDSLGLLVFTPFFHATFRGDFVVCFKRKSWLQRFECLLLLAFVCSVTYWVFYISPYPAIFAIFLPLMLVTFRVGRLGTKAAVMLIAIIGGIATMNGYGPISRLFPGPFMQAQAFQAFLAVTLLICLPVAAEVTARARLTAALAAHSQQMTLSAITDPLTGMLNRGGFEAKLQKKALHRLDARISLIAIDLDHFKQINDRWGHHAGDQALKHLSSILASNTRALDIVGRIGGDEFMIALPDSDLELAKAVGERVRNAARTSPLEIDDKIVTTISLSIGIASARPGETYEGVARRADRALYDAKNAGRNTIRTSA
ncbi:diguanylate cyclase [Methylobacterium komagatae]|uniref:diguanylate cyclase n=1 Tax=Methylobacterium komagatae TaxID=374425 RepID=A0ABW2BQI5_9HYPH